MIASSITSSKSTLLVIQLALQSEIYHYLIVNAISSDKFFFFSICCFIAWIASSLRWVKVITSRIRICQFRICSQNEIKSYRISAFIRVFLFSLLSLFNYARCFVLKSFFDSRLLFLLFNIVATFLIYELLTNRSLLLHFFDLQLSFVKNIARKICQLV